MGLLIRLAPVLVAAVLVAGCYDPALEDCTETCAGAGDCGPGQVCGDDGFCARPSVAGTCTEDVDAAVPPVTAQLTIHIDHKGRVVVTDPAFTCEAASVDNLSCRTTVPGAGTLTLQAVRTVNDFDHWTTENCAGQSATCHLTVMGATPIDVGAKFH